MYRINIVINLPYADYKSLNSTQRQGFLQDFFKDIETDVLSHVKGYFENGGYIGSFTPTLIYLDAHGSYDQYIFYVQYAQHNFIFPMVHINGASACNWGTYSDLSRHFEMTSLKFMISSDLDTGGSIGTPPVFIPPTPTSPKKIEEVPFYEELKKTHDLLALDGLTEEEWDYLKAMQQKNELMEIDKLMEQSKNDYMTALGAGAYDNVFISHDPTDPVSTQFFDDNGLDKSLEYNTNLKNTGLGYKDISGNYKKMDTVLNFNKIQQIDDNTYSQMMTQSEYVAFLGTLTVGGAAVVAGSAAIATYMAYRASKNPEATGNYLGRGLNYLNSQKDRMFSGFTDDGNRQKDLVNPYVPSYGGTYNTKLELNGLENGVNLNAPTTGVDLKISTGTVIGLDNPSWKLELGNPTFDLAITKPDFGLDLELGAKVLPLGVPLGGIDLNVTGKQVALVDGAKVQLDIPDDAALPVEGLDDNFKAVYANRAANIGKTDIVLGHKIEAHNIEYVSDGGVRGKEKLVADWTDLEYKTSVLENGSEVNKINRDIKAWQGMHSLNPNLEYEGVKDSSDNPMDHKKGLVPGLLGLGLVEFLREGALRNLRENNIANLNDHIKENEPDSNDDNGDDNNTLNDILLGLKKIVFPSEGEFQSSLSGEFGDDIKEMASHFMKTEVK